MHRYQPDHEPQSQIQQQLDGAGIDLFAKLVRQLQERHIGLHISGIKLPVEQALRWRFTASTPKR